MRHKGLTDEVRDELVLYALRLLDEVSGQQWKAHLVGCQVCQQELTEIEATMTWLAYSAPSVNPPADLKARVLDRVRVAEGWETRSNVEAQSLWSRLFPGVLENVRWQVALVAILIVVGGGVYLRSLHQTLERQHEQLVALNEEARRLTEQIGQQREVLSLLQSPNASVVVMKGLDASQQGHGKVIWDGVGKRGQLHVTNLPAIPEDRDYQLWQIVDGAPVSAAVFRVGAADQELVSFEPVTVGDGRSVTAFAITIEPKGGVLQPTGPMILLGKMNL